MANFETPDTPFPVNDEPTQPAPPTNSDPSQPSLYAGRIKTDSSLPPPSWVTYGSTSIPSGQLSTLRTEFEAFSKQLQKRISVPIWAIILTSGLVFCIILCMGCSLLSLAAGKNGQDTAVSSQNQATTRQSPTLVSATPTPKPTAIPTATPKPKQWITVNHFSNSVNQQTDTFHISDGSHIVWSYNITDSANFFAISIYSGDGTFIDNLANYANESSGHQSTYTVHGDGDYYLNIQADSVNWNIDIQVYE